MRRQSLRSVIGSVLESELPDYQILDEKNDFIWPNEIPLHKNVGALDLFLVFSPHAQDSGRFTVDVGWSKLGRFPRIDMRPCITDPDDSHTEFQKEEYFTRLGILKSGSDVWWKIRPGGAALEAVSTAMAEIRKTAEPYFELLIRFEREM